MTGLSPHNILRHEIIGLEVRIPYAKDPTLKGIKGTVIDETRNMLVLSRRGKMFSIPKSVATFRFKLQDGTLVDVDGTRLVGHPENRLKIKVKRW